MKSFLISGLVDDYRIKINLFAISPNHAIKVFQHKYPNSKDIYLIQDLFKVINEIGKDFTEVMEVTFAVK